MSTNSSEALTALTDSLRMTSLSMRSSCTYTMPTLGSMVQNGKFAACAEAVPVKALNSVDLPTFGSPTIPVLSDAIRTTPCRGRTRRAEAPTSACGECTNAADAVAKRMNMSMVGGVVVAGGGAAGAGARAG